MAEKEEVQQEQEQQLGLRMSCTCEDTSAVTQLETAEIWLYSGRWGQEGGSGRIQQGRQ